MSKGSFDLTDDNIDDFRRAFALIDKDNDGRISASDLGSFLSSLGTALAPEDLSKLIADVNPDRSGAINFAAFVNVMGITVLGKSKDADIDAVFAMLDKDDNGRVSAANLRQAFRDIGVEISQAEVDEMIRAVDTNGDGLVDVQDLQKLMSS